MLSNKRVEDVEIKYIAGLVKFADKVRDYYIRGEFMFLSRKHFLSKANGKINDAVNFLIKREVEITPGNILNILESSKIIADAVKEKAELIFVDLLDDEGIFAPSNFDEFLMAKDTLYNHFLIRNSVQMFKDFEQKIKSDDGEIEPSIELMKIATSVMGLFEGESESSSLYLKDPDEVEMKVISAYREGFTKWDYNVTQNLPTLRRYINEGAITNSALVTISGIYKGGKTTTALGLARDLASNGARVLYFTREMSENEISDRYVKWFVSKEDYFERVIKNPDPSFLKEVKDELTKLDLIIEKIRNPHIDWVTEKIKSRVIAKDINVVFIDYLQLMRGNERDFRLAINDITASLKGLAMDLNIVIFLLAQENEEGTVKESKSAHADSNLVLSVKMYKTNEKGLTPINGKSYDFGEIGRFGIIQVTCKDSRNTNSGWSYYTGIRDGGLIEVSPEYYEKIEYKEYGKESKEFTF